MNIVFGFVGQNAALKFKLLRDAVDQHIQADLPLKIAQSADGNGIFALLQPSGFFPLEKPFYETKHEYLCMLQGYFWYDFPFPESEEEAKRSIIRAGNYLTRNKYINLSDDNGGLFNYFLYDEKSREFFISCDLSGIFPLYFITRSDGIYFSSHIRALSKALKIDYDPLSVIEHMAFHYTIGRRTLYKGIFRLNAGETLNYSFSTGKLKFTQPSNLYSDITSYRNDEEALEALFHDYYKGVQEICRINQKRGIMLSGGFDTRLVAFGFYQHANPIVGLTLGDSENFEVQIAKKLTKIINADHKIYSPEPDTQLSSDRIVHLIKTVENVNFAYCDSSGSLLKQMGAETVSTGYGGETFFGGQGYSFYGKSLNNKERFKLAFVRSLGFPIKFYDEVNHESFELVHSTIMNFHKKRADK